MSKNKKYLILLKIISSIAFLLLILSDYAGYTMMLVGIYTIIWPYPTPHIATQFSQKNASLITRCIGIVAILLGALIQFK